MILDDGLTLLTAEDLAPDDPAATLLDEARETYDWARSFLCAPNPELGRRGPVCPHARASLETDLLHLGQVAHDPDAAEATRAVVRRYGDGILRRQTSVRPESTHLVCVVIMVLGIDPVDPGPLEQLQRELKPEFVARGLMIGEFHPGCNTRGVWNPEFRPMRSPHPLLAIRPMMPSDLPFLVGDAAYLETYLDRYSQAMPSHTRQFLIRRLMGTADVGTADVGTADVGQGPA
jgi:hypothetical protein